MTIDSFDRMDVTASTELIKHIDIIFTVGNEKHVIEITPHNARWLKGALKQALKLTDYD